MSFRGGDEIAPGIHSGQMRGRWSRAVKNGRWYLADPEVTKIGWGDLSFDDLAVIAVHHDRGRVFVVLGENPGPGYQHLPHAPGENVPGWCWYDRPDCHPVDAEVLATASRFAVVDGVLYCTEQYYADRPTAVLPADVDGSIELPAMTSGELRQAIQRAGSD